MRKRFCKGKRAVKVYSLSGPSGTGKSTSALAFAHKLGVEAIVDDGLLIVNGVRVAGLSAKFEKIQLPLYGVPFLQIQPIVRLSKKR